MTKLLPIDLAGMLEFGGFIHPGATDDDDLMCRIGYFADLINSHVARPEATAKPDASHEAGTAGYTESGRAAMAPSGEPSRPT